MLLLVDSYARQGKPFDGLLHSAIEDVAVGKRPAADWPGVHEVFSVPVPKLRQRLFALVKDEAAETRLAAACLTAIDELRDRYGQPESDLYSADCHKGLCGHVRQNLSLGYAIPHRWLAWTTWAIERSAPFVKRR